MASSEHHHLSVSRRLSTAVDDEPPEKPAAAAAAAKGDASEGVVAEVAKRPPEPPAPSGDNRTNQPANVKPVSSEAAEPTLETSGSLEGRQRAKTPNAPFATERPSPSERKERTEDVSKQAIRPKDGRRREEQLHLRAEGQKDRPIARPELKLTTCHGDYVSRGIQLKREVSDELMTTSDGGSSPEEGSIVSKESGTPPDAERPAHVEASVQVLRSGDERIRLPAEETVPPTAEVLPRPERSAVVKPRSSHEAPPSPTGRPKTLAESEAITVLEGDLLPIASDTGSPIAKETLHFVLRRACCVSLSASVYGDDEPYNDIYSVKYTRALDEKQQREAVFPNTLEEFGYYFNEEGVLRSTDGSERFNFLVKDDDDEYNQKWYEAFEKVITKSVCQLLEQKASLKNFTVPTDSQNDQSKGSFFMSSRALEKDTLLLLISASDKARAGQWTSRLMTTEVFNKGSQLPYIEFGQKQGYGVLILSITMNRNTENTKTWKQLICGCESPEDYALCVWDHFIENSKAKYIAVVAHSYGALVTARLSDKREEFRRRVFAIAFIDSVHCPGGLSKHTKRLFAEHAVNWVRSGRSADVELGVFEDLKCRSAGHPTCELASYSAKESIFDYIMDKHKQALDRSQTVNRQKLCTCM